MEQEKMKMWGCNKCSRTFCSTINYRRHKRVPHPSKKHDDDSAKIRDLLGQFWDKLSEEDAKEAISILNATIEEVPGSSIDEAFKEKIMALKASPVPTDYLQAGVDLMFLRSLWFYNSCRGTIQSGSSYCCKSESFEWGILMWSSMNIFVRMHE